MSIRIVDEAVKIVAWFLACLVDGWKERRDDKAWWKEMDLLRRPKMFVDKAKPLHWIISILAPPCQSIIIPLSSSPNFHNSTMKQRFSSLDVKVRWPQHEKHLQILIVPGHCPWALQCFGVSPSWEHLWSLYQNFPRKVRKARSKRTDCHRLGI